MARINIEDSLYKDNRFWNLCLKLGCRERAVGALVLAWAVAQKWYLTPERMIPKSEWEKQGLNNALIDVGLAELKDNKIKMAGADDQFAWLLQRVEAGKLGGVARRDKTMSYEEQARREGARVVLGKAVKNGDVVKPSACSSCDKKTTLDGHHSDYSKPLDVIWLCKSCHTRIHWDIQAAVANQPLAEAKPLSPSPTLSLKTKNNTRTKNEAEASSEILVNIWNSNCGTLSKVTSMNPSRKQKSLARWKENPDPLYWTEVVRRIAASDFCNGMGSGSRGWKATFDYLIQPTTHLKVIEGGLGGYSEPQLKRVTLE